MVSIIIRISYIHTKCHLQARIQPQFVFWGVNVILGGKYINLVGQLRPSHQQINFLP